MALLALNELKTMMSAISMIETSTAPRPGSAIMLACLRKLGPGFMI